jgi:deoxyribodipyrimidine photo-lyase
MSTAIVWLRQDLRLMDNPALYYAAKENDDVILLYILDETLPWKLGDAQRWWLHHSLHALQVQLKKQQITLTLKRGNSHDIIIDLCKTYPISRIYWNRCYEPATIARETTLKKTLDQQGIKAQSYNGSLLREPWEILNKQGGYFKIFSAFWKNYVRQPPEINLLPAPSLQQKTRLASENLDMWKLLPTKPNWASGFHLLWQPGELSAQKKLKRFIADLLKRFCRHIYTLEK